MLLPPKFAERNAQENVQQATCNNGLGERFAQNGADIIDYCYHAQRQLEDQPWRVMAPGCAIEL